MPQTPTRTPALSAGPIAQIWPAGLERLIEDFPCLDRAALRATGGHPAGLVACLSEAHDLTCAEAAEVLGDFAARRYRPDAASAAA